MLADALAAYAALGPDVRLYLPPSEARLDAALWTGETVSYTHLTLPTICSV